MTCVTEVRGQHKSVSHAFQLPLHVIVINLTWVGDSVLYLYEVCRWKAPSHPLPGIVLYWRFPWHVVLPLMLQHTCNIMYSSRTFQRNSPHSVRGTHLLATSSSTLLKGHWHPATHCRVQMGWGLAQVRGHALPQDWNSWPSIGQGSAWQTVQDNQPSYSL